MKIEFRHERKYKPLELSWVEAKILEKSLTDEINKDGYIETNKDDWVVNCKEEMVKLLQRIQLETYGGKTTVKLYDDNDNLIRKAEAHCLNKDKNNRDAYNREKGRLAATYNLYHGIRKRQLKKLKKIKDKKERKEAKIQHEEYLDYIKAFLLNSGIKNIECIFQKYFKL